MAFKVPTVIIHLLKMILFVPVTYPFTVEGENAGIKITTDIGLRLFYDLGLK